MPAAIAEKSKEQLQQYVLDLLKKLKLRDKKIEGERKGGCQQQCKMSCLPAES